MLMLVAAPTFIWQLHKDYLMEIRIRETGQVMFESEFRQYHIANNGPTWELTTLEILDELGADIVFEGPQAQPTRYQVAFRDGVEEIGGKWYTKHSVTDLDVAGIAQKDENQSKSIRDQRNKLLSESDWTQIVDSPVDKIAWATYRQSLRDITAQDGFPWVINWPEKP